MRNILSLLIHMTICYIFSFFFNDTATTEIYTLSLHDALPIYDHGVLHVLGHVDEHRTRPARAGHVKRDRKSTRLNSSHQIISYAVFCLKKKKIKSFISTQDRVTL